MSHFRQDSEEAEDIFASTFSSSTAVGKVKISGGDSGTEQLFYVPVAAVSGGGIGIKGAPTGAVSEKQQILEKGQRQKKYLSFKLFS